MSAVSLHQRTGVAASVLCAGCWYSNQMQGVPVLTGNSKSPKCNCQTKTSFLWLTHRAALYLREPKQAKYGSLGLINGLWKPTFVRNTRLVLSPARQTA